MQLFILIKLFKKVYYSFFHTINTNVCNVFLYSKTLYCFFTCKIQFRLQKYLLIFKSMFQLQHILLIISLVLNQ